MDIVSCELHVLLQVVISEMNHHKANFKTLEVESHYKDNRSRWRFQKAL